MRRTLAQKQTNPQARTDDGIGGGGAWLLLLPGAALWLPVLAELWANWEGDDTLSHGPVVALLAVGLLWAGRDALRKRDVPFGPGLALLAVFTLLHVLALFADVVFLKSLSLIGMTLCAVGYLLGRRPMRVAAGAMGFLLFVIPWPTTLTERLAFPLQLMSSAYAAMFGGMAGLPIVREGIQLSVVPTPGGEPIYSVLVAKACSGLTSMTVLLALGYLFAYVTPVSLRWRAVFLLIVPPLALLANTVRLTAILMAGTYSSPAVAQWVHDHEAPVLIFFCSLGLMALRQVILSVAGDPKNGKGATVVPADLLPAPGRGRSRPPLLVTTSKPIQDDPLHPALESEKPDLIIVGEGDSR